MTYVKLTIAMRDAIRLDLLRHRFSAEVLQMEAQRAALARLVYENVLGRENLHRIDDLPANWLPLDHSIGVKMGEKVTHLNFSGHTDSTHLHRLYVDRPTVEGWPLPNCYKGVAKVYDAVHPLAVRYEELQAHKKDLEERVTQASAATRAALDVPTTLIRLREMWPEIAPFLTKYSMSPAPVPALRSVELNALLGLAA